MISPTTLQAQLHHRVTDQKAACWPGSSGSHWDWS